MKQTLSITSALTLTFALALALSSCSSKKIKDGINKTGDAAGQAIGEFSSGVSTGVEKATEPTIEISDALKSQGISLGKINLSKDSGSTDNTLSVYIIFSKDFKGYLTAKAFDKKDLEMGRVKEEVEGKKDEAKYIDFHFDKRTDIDIDSRLVVE